MILHSIQIGTRNVHVRTDDCDQRELERVHEAVRLVERMRARNGSEAYGLAAGLIAFIGAAAITLVTMSPGPARAIIPLVACVIASTASWQLLAGNIHQRQRADAFRLWALTLESTRCRDFVNECAEVLPALSHALGDAAALPERA